MSSSDSKQLITYLFVIFIIVVSLGFTYSLSNSSNLERAQGITGQTGSDRWSSHSQIIDDYVLLAKDSKLVIGNTCLNFRGLERKSALIDLYLLEFDDEESFTKKIDRKNRQQEIHFGDYRYQLVTANKKFVKLRLLTTSATP